jgi:predicted SAM-dependent methyltransferase
MKTLMNMQTKKRYSLIRELVGDARNKIIIDLGAGDLPISSGIISAKTITVDADKKNHPGIICDITKDIWPIEKNCADIIIAGEIIEHLDDNLSFLKNCNRILKKGGKVVLSTPNICSLKNRLKVLFGSLPEYCASPKRNRDFNNHLTDFNLKELTKMLVEAGFEVRRTRTNGIVSYGKILFPSLLTPAALGEIIIVEAVKI